MVPHSNNALWQVTHTGGSRTAHTMSIPTTMHRTDRAVYPWGLLDVRTGRTQWMPWNIAAMIRHGTSVNDVWSGWVVGFWAVREPLVRCIRTGDRVSRFGKRGPCARPYAESPVRCLCCGTFWEWMRHCGIIVWHVPGMHPSHVSRETFSVWHTQCAHYCDNPSW